MSTYRKSPPAVWVPDAVEIDAEVGIYLSPSLQSDTNNPTLWHWCTKANNDAYIHSPRYPAGHGWTPTGRFGPVRCKVLLARYSCPYPREEHDPNLPPEDVDFSGRRRPRDPKGRSMSTQDLALRLATLKALKSAIDAEWETAKSDLLAEFARLTAERDALAAQVARVEALAEEWRYKGQFGWGAWQIGEGPDPEGYVMDHCASALRAALAGFEADTTDTQSTDQEVK